MRPLDTSALLSLMLIIQAGCSGLSQRTTPGNRQYRSFSLRVGEGQEEKMSLMAKALRDSIKDKLTQKGYIYKEEVGAADLNGVIQYKTRLKKAGYLQLEVRLDIYDRSTSQKLFSTSVSNTVLHQDVVGDLIQPVARQLTLRFPYANHLGGIGVLIGNDLKIKGFSRNSPARESGLQVNDVITEINGKQIKDIKECLNMLKGEVNTQVELTVERNKQKLRFTVGRISLNQMMKNPTIIDEAARRRLQQDFRREVLQQQP
jgi:C-terminal processing protease CtpA/Prc